MKREYFNHLERAFTEAPLELVSSVEEGFRRGEKTVKQRHKILTALSVVAILTVLFVAIALAIGMALKPKVDSVVAAPGDGGVGGRTLPLPQQKETSPIITSRSQPEQYPEDQVYYATSEGFYFHMDANCGGMHNALPISWDAAWIKGKWPCPKCLDEARVPHLWFFSTTGGKYYHLKAECSGMQNDKPTFPAVLMSGNRQPCPVCIPDDLLAFCWATPQGQYYHSKRDCMGMLNARIYTAAYTRYLGKQACPICFGSEMEAESKENDIPAPETTHERITVYYTPQGEYYHGDNQCCGMQNAGAHTLSEALDNGKSRCPICRPGAPDGLDLFRSTFGCELEALYPGTRYAYTQTDAQTGVWEWMLSYSDDSDRTYGSPISLEKRTIREGAGLPGHVGERLPCMSVLTSKESALTVWHHAPEPLHSMLEEAVEQLCEMPEMLEGIDGTPLERLTRVIVTFDEEGKNLLAVTMWFEGAETATFRWALKEEDGEYEMILPATVGMD